MKLIENKDKEDKEDKEESPNTAIVISLCNQFKYEIMRCISCPIVLECKYPSKRLKILQEEASEIATKVYEEELELDNTTENIILAHQKREQAYRNYLLETAKGTLKNDRCLYERQEIINVLQKFVNAGYNLADPRAYLIIKELVSNILNSGRSNKAFTSLGILLKKDSPTGPIYYSNPLLKAKVEFSKSIIEAIEALDRILKSDDAQKADASFTQHLINRLRIRKSNDLVKLEKQNVK